MDHLCIQLLCLSTRLLLALRSEVLATHPSHRVHRLSSRAGGWILFQYVRIDRFVTLQAMDAEAVIPRAELMYRPTLDVIPSFTAIASKDHISMTRLC